MRRPLVMETLVRCEQGSRRNFTSRMTIIKQPLPCSVPRVCQSLMITGTVLLARTIDLFSADPRNIVFPGWSLSDGGPEKFVMPFPLSFPT